MQVKSLFYNIRSLAKCKGLLLLIALLFLNLSFTIAQTAKVSEEAKAIRQEMKEEREAKKEEKRLKKLEKKKKKIEKRVKELPVDKQNTYNEIREERDPKYLDGFEKDRKKLLGKDRNERVSTPPNRYFEIGFLFNTSISENVLGLKDILKENLTIDLPSIYNNMDSYGFLFNFDILTNAFINLNLKKGIHVGIKTGLDGYGYLNIGESLFKLLAKGNKLNKKIKMESDVEGDLFFFVNLAVGFDFLGFHLELAPSIFLPLTRTITRKNKFEALNDKTGAVDAVVKTQLNMYTFIPMDSIFDGGLDGDTITSNIKEGWGFDMFVSLEHALHDKVIGGVSVNFPIVPGQINHCMKMDIQANVHVNPLTEIGGIEAAEEYYGKKKPGEQEDFEGDFDIGDKVYKKESIKINRPFKLNAEVAYRPFGKWFTVGAMLGLGVRNPFTLNLTPFVEYKIRLDLDCFIKKFNLIGLRLSTSYTDQVFRHTVGMALNFRALELDVGISAVSGSFVASFKGAGVGAYIGFAVGW